MRAERNLIKTVDNNPAVSARKSIPPKKNEGVMGVEFDQNTLL